MSTGVDIIGLNRPSPTVVVLSVPLASTRRPTFFPPPICSSSFLLLVFVVTYSNQYEEERSNRRHENLIPRVSPSPKVLFRFVKHMRPHLSGWVMSKI